MFTMINRRQSAKWIVLLWLFIQTTYASEKEIATIMANNEAIQVLDQRLNENYVQLMKLLPENQKKTLKREQRAWLKKRNAMLHSMPELKNAYIERDEILKSQFFSKFDYIESVLITGEEKIDYQDKLAKISSCTLDLCNAYSAYFLYKIDTPQASSTAINAEILLRSILDTQRQHDISEIPLWLVIEHPWILTQLGERFSPRVKADYHTKELPCFSKLRFHLFDMEEGHWKTTSYKTHVGSITRDIAADYENYLDYLSFYPQGILGRLRDEGRLEGYTTTDKNLFPLLAWSYQGIWNRNSYFKFEKLFVQTVSELKNYYKEHERLKDFADRAELLLSTQIYNSFPIVYPIAETKAFQIFHEPYLSIEALKQKTNDFTREDWDQALSIAILNHYPLETIEWIIQSGANVNAAYLNETPLMKAIEQPAILVLLLKHGAHVDQETPFGKTALFYAVQFNQLESVKLLITAKANINHRLKNLAAFIELHSKDDYLLEKVDSFTPYIYSLKYASPEMTQYLLAMGADPKALPQEQYKGWEPQKIK